MYNVYQSEQMLIFLASLGVGFLLGVLYDLFRALRLSFTKGKIAGIIFALYLCIHYWPSAAIIFKTAFAAVLPLLIGTVVAYPLDILTSFFERHLLSKSQNKFITKS